MTIRWAAAAGLAVLLVAVLAVGILLLLQVTELGDRVERAQSSIAAISHALVEQAEPGRVAIVERLTVVERRLSELADGLEGDPSADGAGGGGTTGDDHAELLDEVREIRSALDELRDRLDEICEGVPIC
jgi:hypothetical protein